MNLIVGRRMRHEKVFTLGIKKATHRVRGLSHCFTFVPDATPAPLFGREVELEASLVAQH